MNKYLVAILVAGILFGSLGVVLAQVSDEQPVEGIVEQVVFTLSPETLNFGAIPLGTDVTDDGPNVEVETDGSVTESGMVMLSIAVDDSSLHRNFFESLLNFKENGEPDGSFVLVESFTTQFDAGSALILNTRISGNTQEFGAGAKSGVLVYTVTGTPPSP